MQQRISLHNISSLLKQRRERDKMKIQAGGMSKGAVPNHVVITMFLLSLFLLMSVASSKNSPSGKKGGGTCKPSGVLKGKKPHGRCQDNCCKAGKSYPAFHCSPPVTKRTKATLTINSFAKGGDGGGPSECDGKFHSDNTPVVALSTGWFNQRKRCHKSIIIFGNGRRVKATVVDECDSRAGCDGEHGFQPPCPNNVVDASKAVWEALGVPKKDWGELHVEWTDA